MPRRRGCDFDPDEIDQTHLGAAAPAPGIPKASPRKREFPPGFDINPDHYRPKPPKRRKRGPAKTD